MKLTPRTVLALAALPFLPLPAATIEHLQVAEQVDPTYPQGLQLLGITKGAVRCVIDVDPAGRVEEVLVIAYTHEAFAKRVSEVMPLWRFVPAKRDGRPVPSQATIEFFIEATGVVISIDPMMAVNLLLSTYVRGEFYVYRPSGLKELDRIPVPLETVKPVYPAALAQQNVRGRVRVNFYIDETGKVRMPIVAQSEHEQLSAAAVDAVRQWRFEPPLRHGRPVLVQASQDFDFAGSL